MGMDLMKLLSILDKTRSNVERLRWLESEFEAELDRRGAEMEVVEALRKVRSKIVKVERRKKRRGLTKKPPAWS